MKISELLQKNTLSLSFEVFPPKTETAFESVKTATEEIAKLRPLFMSVTYGAGGGTSKYTLDIAKNIKELYGVPSLAHLTCVSSTKDTVHQRIEDMKAAGIQNVMALRGDIPKELADAAEHVADLVQLDLGLDAVDELVDLLVGQVDADELLDDGYGIPLELGHQVLVGSQLLDDFLDLCLDIHGVSSCLRWFQCSIWDIRCQILLHS